MDRPKCIFYTGTYEQDYPRNVLIIAALRRAGFDVREYHRTVWPDTYDKSAAVGSPRTLFRIALRAAIAYGSLSVCLMRRRSNADLIVIGYIGQLDMLVLGSLARILRKPILFNPLVTLTDTLIEDRRRVPSSGLRARLIRAADALALRMSSLTLADTRANRDYLVSEFGVDADHVAVVPVGADEAIFKPASDLKPETGGDRQLRVLFYGNMIPLQGVETILLAAELLKARGDVRFSIIGTGQTYYAVRSLASNLDLNNVEFVDRVPYQQLPQHIQNAEVVLGIFGDTAKAARVVPNKVYQAMAMGAAIISRDSSACRDMLTDGESALLVPPKDPVALANAIERLFDEELRKRLGTAARERFLERASLDHVAARLETAVDVACSGRSSLPTKVTA